MTFWEWLAWQNWTGLAKALKQRQVITSRKLTQAQCPVCGEPPGEWCEWFLSEAPALLLCRNPVSAVHAGRIADIWPQLHPAVRKHVLALFPETGIPAELAGLTA
jgi:hypothetical protein